MCILKKQSTPVPIVRKEDEWKDVDLEKRRKVFFKMFSFMRLSPISYKTFSVRKRECADRFALRGRLANELGSFLRDNLAFFQGFESVIVYYDNGQALVTDTHQHRALRVSDECGCPQDSSLRIQAEPDGGHGLHAGAYAGEI